jgi:hypothetical protein
MNHTTNTEKLNENQLRPILQFLLDQNIAATNQNPAKLGTPLCIWGPHGIGKTELVADIARENGWQFAYCAPGQFEEMGDFHGMPVIAENPDGTKTTKTAPPDWVPKEEGPGILLLDDINRADDRILRGIMQLLQNHQMGSWRLPQKWQIVATANPDGAGYSVTSMDEAMMTRMLHFNLQFNAKVWAGWATRHGVDPRGVSFVLSYPEMVSGKRTTARTLTQFFEQIRAISNLRKETQLVRQIALSCLDPETVRAFMAFISDDLALLPDPEEILYADSTARSAWKQKIVAAAAGKAGVKRVDRLSVIIFRVLLHVSAEDFEPSDVVATNFIQLLKLPVIPKDLGIGQLPELLERKNKSLQALLKRDDVQRELGDQFVDDLLDPKMAA